VHTGKRRIDVFRKLSMSESLTTFSPVELPEPGVTSALVFKPVPSKSMPFPQSVSAGHPSQQQQQRTRAGSTWASACSTPSSVDDVTAAASRMSFASPHGPNSSHFQRQHQHQHQRQHLHQHQHQQALQSQYQSRWDEFQQQQQQQLLPPPPPPLQSLFVPRWNPSEGRDGMRGVGALDDESVADNAPVYRRFFSPLAHGPQHLDHGWNDASMLQFSSLNSASVGPSSFSMPFNPAAQAFVPAALADTDEPSACEGQSAALVWSDGALVECCDELGGGLYSHDEPNAFLSWGPLPPLPDHGGVCASRSDDNLVSSDEALAEEDIPLENNVNALGDDESSRKVSASAGSTHGLACEIPPSSPQRCARVGGDMRSGGLNKSPISVAWGFSEKERLTSPAVFEKTTIGFPCMEHEILAIIPREFTPTQSCFKTAFMHNDLNQPPFF